MSYTSFNHFFTTLANKQRVKILQLLANEGPRSVTSVAEALMMEQSATSHCLKQLLECHFVAVQQSGKIRIYSINEDTVKPLFELIGNHVRKYCLHGCEHWESNSK
jgi:DNA-binding transcriptional ArsR family regulator